MAESEDFTQLVDEIIADFWPDQDASAPAPAAAPASAPGLMPVPAPVPVPASAPGLMPATALMPSPGGAESEFLPMCELVGSSLTQYYGLESGGAAQCTVGNHLIPEGQRFYLFRDAHSSMGVCSDCNSRHFVFSVRSRRRDSYAYGIGFKGTAASWKVYTEGRVVSALEFSGTSNHQGRVETYFKNVWKQIARIDNFFKR